MTPLVFAAPIILAAAILNRVRGGGFFGDRLPGHPRFYVAAAMGLLTPPSLPWQYMPIVAGCFLFWSWLPWGRWFDLGRLNPEILNGIRERTWFERAIEGVVGRSDHVCFAVRNLIAIIPAAIFISPIFMFLPAVQSAAYEIGWRYAPDRPIEIGELITGAAWGLLLVAVALL